MLILDSPEAFLAPYRYLKEIGYEFEHSIVTAPISGAVEKQWEDAHKRGVLCQVFILPCGPSHDSRVYLDKVLLQLNTYRIHCAVVLSPEVAQRIYKVIDSLPELQKELFLDEQARLTIHVHP